MDKYLDNPIFGLVITILVFKFSQSLNKKIKMPLLNPVLISIVIIISILSFFDISYTVYNRGGSIISFFLGPATVVLGFSLYRQIHLLKENFIPIVMGILIGSISGLGSIILLSKLLGIEDLLIYSMLPKSTTSAIAIDISKSIGGNPSITIGFVIITGVFGYMIAPSILNRFKIDNKVARGISIGTASHVIGTARALELGEIEGAMSSLAIGVAGLMTVFLAPIMIYIYNLM